MGVIREVEMWRSGTIHCVLIRHEDPQGLIIQVRREQDVIVSVWCADPDFAAEEADHWFEKFVTDGHDSNPALASRDRPPARSHDRGAAQHSVEATARQRSRRR
jgi:hypothetical protein